MPNTAQSTRPSIVEPAPALGVGSPGPGEEAVLTVEMGQVVILGFDMADGQARIDVDALQFLLRDGGIVTLEGFRPAAASGRPPILVLSDGTRVTGNLLIEALESLLSEAETAAGPAQVSPGAAGAYDDDLGDLAFIGPQVAGLGGSGLGLGEDGALSLDGSGVDAIANFPAAEQRPDSGRDDGRPDVGAAAQTGFSGTSTVLPGVPAAESGVFGSGGESGQPGPGDDSGGAGGSPDADPPEGPEGPEGPGGPGGPIRLRGGAGDDALAGGTGDDRLDGRGGDDELDGGDGRDRLHGGRGDDSLTGGDGDDDLRGGAGDDALDGDAGADRLRAGSGEDTLRGGAGDDVLEAGSGDDILVGGPGADLLKGAAGADVFVLEFDRAGALDVIADFKPKQGDVLNLHNVLAGETGTVPGLDADSIDGYLQFTARGHDTILSVDPSGGGGAFTAIAILDGARSLDAGNLFERGAIDVTAPFG